MPSTGRYAPPGSCERLFGRQGEGDKCDEAVMGGTIAKNQQGK